MGVRLPRAEKIAEAFDSNHGDLLKLKSDRFELERIMDRVMVAHGCEATPKVLISTDASLGEKNALEDECWRRVLEWFKGFREISRNSPALSKAW